MDTVLLEFRHSVRQLVRRPVQSAAVILSLALAIGANAAIFGAVQALLLRPLPFAQPERLVDLFGVWPSRGWPRTSLSLPNIVDYGTEAKSLTGIAGYRLASQTADLDGRPTRVLVSQSTSDLFPVLGVAPTLGRTFTPEESGSAAAAHVVVLGHGIWVRMFGADPAVLGRDLDLDGVPHEIIGVLPPTFRYPSDGVELWTPLGADPSTWGRWRGGLRAVARLAPGVSLSAARAELTGVAARLAEEFPQSNEGQDVGVVALEDDLYPASVRTMLFTLFGAVGLLLLIACVNAANIRFAQATNRRNELLVRSALGATRGRLGGVLITESLILALAGGALGILVGMGGMELLRLGAPSGIVRATDISLNVTVGAFTLGVSVAAGLLFGWLPAWHASRASAAAAVRSSTAGGGETRSHLRLSRALIVLQVATAFVVLTGAGLMMRSLAAAFSVDPGFELGDRTAFSVQLPEEYGDVDAVRSFVRRTEEGLRGLSGVEAVGTVADLPLATGANLVPVLVEGQVPDNPGAIPAEPHNVVDGGYFRTLGIRVEQGRVFEPSDDDGSVPVAVVSESFAGRFWPSGTAVGKRVAVPGETTTNGPHWRTVVGVVADVRHDGLTAQPRRDVYFPLSQWSGRRGIYFVIHGSRGAGALTAPIHTVISRVDPHLAVDGVSDLRTLARGRMGNQWSLLWLLATFGVTALALVCVGLFGLVSHYLSRRRLEFGVRAALGAPRDRLFGMIVRREMATVGVGVALGVGAALLAARALAGFLYRVEPYDPLTLIAVAVVLLGVGFSATLGPALRAARLDPVRTLRTE